MDTDAFACGFAADTSTSYTTVMTPSASTIAEGENFPLESSVPHAGKVFIIHDHKTGRVLTLLNGDMSLQPPGTPGSAYHWMCEELNGWLGFKNTASGTYLGRNSYDQIYARATQHRDWENSAFECSQMADMCFS